eukprot:PLAT255.1.p1 GENE.PLAT255.1~~PLAT255.1.p1  ORF type:complete len:844 (+),score=284.27 PLAT255.1:1208-3739(+)
MSLLSTLALPPTYLMLVVPCTVGRMDAPRCSWTCWLAKRCWSALSAVPPPPAARPALSLTISSRARHTHSSAISATHACLLVQAAPPALDYMLFPDGAGGPEQVFQAGEPCSLRVLAMPGTAALPLDASRVTASFSGPLGAHRPTHVLADVARTDSGLLLSSTLTRSGLFRVTAMVEGKHVLGSPLTATILPGRVGPSKCFAWGDGLRSARRNAVSSFYVQACDHFGNRCKGGVSDLRLRICRETGEELQAVHPEPQLEPSGEYLVGYQAEHCGRFLLHVLVDGFPITDSPFSLQVSNATEPDACSIILPERAKLPAGAAAASASSTLTARGDVGSRFHFTVVACSEGGVKQPTGGDHFVVTTIGASTVDAEVEDNSDGTYAVQFVPLVPGRYMVAVRCLPTHQHIAGSPFRLEVEADRQDYATFLRTRQLSLRRAFDSCDYDSSGSVVKRELLAALSHDSELSHYFRSSTVFDALAKEEEGGQLLRWDELLALIRAAFDDMGKSAGGAGSEEEVDAAMSVTVAPPPSMSKSEKVRRFSTATSVDLSRLSFMPGGHGDDGGSGGGSGDSAASTPAGSVIDERGSEEDGAVEREGELAEVCASLRGQLDRLQRELQLQSKRAREREAWVSELESNQFRLKRALLAEQAAVRGLQDKAAALERRLPSQRLFMPSPSAGSKRSEVAPAPLPLDDDTLSMARYLGMDVDKHRELLWIARAALFAPLPHGWREQRDADGAVYYWDCASGHTSWKHPYDSYYRQLFKAHSSPVDGRPASAPAERSGEERRASPRRPAGSADRQRKPRRPLSAATGRARAAPPAAGGRKRVPRRPLSAKSSLSHRALYKL